MSLLINNGAVWVIQCGTSWHKLGPEYSSWIEATISPREGGFLAQSPSDRGYNKAEKHAERHNLGVDDDMEEMT